MMKWSNPFTRMHGTPPTTPANDGGGGFGSTGPSPGIQADRAELAELLEALEQAEHDQPEGVASKDRPAQAHPLNASRAGPEKNNENPPPEIRYAAPARAEAKYGDGEHDDLADRDPETAEYASDGQPGSGLPFGYGYDPRPYDAGRIPESDEMAALRARYNERAMAAYLHGAGSPAYYEHLRISGIMEARDEEDEAALLGGPEEDGEVQPDYLRTSVQPHGEGGVEASISIDFEALFQDRLNKVVAALGDRIGDDVEAIREDLAAAMRSEGFQAVTGEDMASLASDMAEHVVTEVEVMVHHEEP